MSFRTLSSFGLTLFLSFGASAFTPAFAQDPGLGAAMPRPAASQAFQVIQLELSGGKLPFRQVVVLKGDGSVTIARFAGTPEKRIATMIGLATPQEMAAVDAALAKSATLPPTVTSASQPAGDSNARLWVARGTVATTETTGSVTALAQNALTEPLADAVSNIAARVQAHPAQPPTPVQPATPARPATPLPATPLPATPLQPRVSAPIQGNTSIVKKLTNLDGSDSLPAIAPVARKPLPISTRTLVPSTAAATSATIAERPVIAPVASSTYTIKRGDTLWDLAQAHQMTWEQLYNYEGNSTRLRSGDPHWIYPGETIAVPAAKTSAAPAQTSATPAQTSAAPAQTIAPQQAAPIAKAAPKPAPVKVGTPVRGENDASTIEPRPAGPAAPSTSPKTLPPVQKKPDLLGPLG
jgi:LysM repeat protein